MRCRLLSNQAGAGAAESDARASQDRVRNSQDGVRDSWQKPDNAADAVPTFADRARSPETRAQGQCRKSRQSAKASHGGQCSLSATQEDLRVALAGFEAAQAELESSAKMIADLKARVATLEGELDAAKRELLRCEGVNADLKKEIQVWFLPLFFDPLRGVRIESQIATSTLHPTKVSLQPVLTLLVTQGYDSALGAQHASLGQDLPAFDCFHLSVTR